jgi:molybdate transport system substrate-binding protein
MIHVFKKILSSFQMGLLALFLGGTASAAEIKVIASTAMKSSFDEIIPVFEQRTGHKVVLPYYSSADGRRRMKEGEAFDVAITDLEAFHALVKDGVSVADPVTVVAINAVELAYPSSALKPDVSTPEKLKSVLLSAKSISYSDPALGGGSSVYFQSVIEQLGIAEIVRAKDVKAKSGQGAVPVAEGKAEIGIAQASEIVSLKGLSSTPIMTEDPKSRSIYGIGISAKSQQMEAARAFVQFLKSPEALSGLRRNGLSAP